MNDHRADDDGLLSEAVTRIQKEHVIRKGEELWQNFVAAFLKEVRSMPVSDRNRFWSERTDRTSTYDALLPQVGDRLAMTYVPEFMRVDGHFKKVVGPDAGFPQIWVEYENEIGKTLEEMDKLCYLRSFLKVLITVGAWPRDWKGRWCSYVKGNNVWLPELQETAYGFIVGEAKRSGTGKECLYFHFFAISPDGREISEEREELIGEVT